MKTFITGSGAWLPENVVDNEDLAQRLAIDAERIFKSSGIRSRRWAGQDTTTSSLGSRALERAIADAEISPASIDYLLFGTMTPDRFIPGSAPALQKATGLREVPCLDIRAACCNALYAMQVASALVSSGTARYVAICLAEIQSRFLDLTPESATLSMLFGDGASALIVSAEPGPQPLEIVDVLLATDGSYADDLGIRSPGTEFGGNTTHDIVEQRADFIPRMNGQAVILQASRRMVAASHALLERNGLCAESVRWIVPHQANANLLAQVARGLGVVDGATELINVLAEYGNTSSASMGIALDTLRRSGKIQAGDYLLLPAFAAGFTWGAALIRG
ncbi:MAG: ketoacyl-ACP synthase III [Acidobacteriota bacterium]|nr:ketoacyl-ACP synthase III [Acidobacteriota bacterium]